MGEGWLHVVVPRRRLIGGTILGGVAAALPAWPATAWAAPARADLWARSRFQEQVGQTFTLAQGKTSWRGTLLAVGDLSGPAGAEQRCFSLTLALSAPGPAEGRATLSRPGFAATEIFWSTDAARRSYVAVVNRL